MLHRQKGLIVALRQGKIHLKAGVHRLFSDAVDARRSTQKLF